MLMLRFAEKETLLSIKGFSCRNAYVLVYSLDFRYACTFANVLVKTKLNGKLEQLILEHKKSIFRRFARGQVNGEVFRLQWESRTKYIKPRM